MKHFSPCSDSCIPVPSTVLHELVRGPGMVSGSFFSGTIRINRTFREYLRNIHISGGSRFHESNQSSVEAN